MSDGLRTLARWHREHLARREYAPPAGCRGGGRPHPSERNPVSKNEVIDPLKEIQEIPSIVSDITKFLEPGALEKDASELNAAYASLTVAGHIDGDEAGYEACKTALNQRVVKFRTSIEAEHARLKAPFWNAGKALDARKNAGIALTSGLEARLKGEIKGHEDKLARLAREEEERRKKKTNDRLQEAMQAGIVVNATDAEQMPDEEWEAHKAQLIAEKAERDSEEVKRQRAQAEARDRIIKRMEIASKLGASLSREDAEYLTSDEFSALEAQWEADKQERDRIQADQLEVQDLKARASAQGFLLTDMDIAGWENREASFMAWMAEQVKSRTKQQEANRKQAYMLERSALLLEGEIVSVKVLMEATPEEWSTIYRQILEDREQAARAKSAPAAPAPQDQPAPTAQAPASHAEELSAICRDFAAFGRSLPSEELKAALRPIYGRMLDLSKRL